ncbi:MAG: dihydrolipoyllysine-residue acetyltransferase [Thiotrichales bacterium]|nr:dihydrolipoyllysine-residue acetyltransferase [Thiotrichales bacterium]
MTELTEVRVPDIGDFSDVPVIEVLVEVGDRIRTEDPLVTLESDKATMDVPAPAAGVVRELSVTVGDSVSQGSVLLRIETEGAADAAEGSGATGTAEATTDHRAPAGDRGVESTGQQDGAGGDGPGSVGHRDPTTAADEPAAAESTAGATPARSRDTGDIGGGDATDRTPTPVGAATETASTDAGSSVTGASAPDPRAPQGRPSPTAALAPESAPRAASHATPAMRRYARELGVDLAKVKGTGRKGRILREDISGFVKKALSAPASAPTLATATAPVEGGGIPPVPAVDFSRFGEIETRPLPRIKRISGPHLHRSWLNVPHVTNHDEADVTDLEAFRRSIKDEAAAAGARITLLAFVTRAVAATLGAFPTFNASLSPDGDAIILKKYVHIGIAVDTPNGLMVPVLRDADRRGVYDLAREMAELGARAREGGLKPTDMQGGTFTISSLGGIGGTAFTPIINAPEVAILGLSRSRMAPVWDGAAFQPRLMLPLDLSWDHRVVDGAEAARFLTHLARLLADVRRLLL